MIVEEINSNSSEDSHAMNPATQIKDVWAYNLEEEFNIIREVAKKYKYIALDTEFPGSVVEPCGVFRNRIERHYRRVKCDVELLKLIQLGITFFDENGNVPTEHNSTWQFNFKFERDKEMYSEDSMNLLQKSGVQFPKLYTDGIKPADFAALMLSSGLLKSNDITWISFQGGLEDLAHQSHVQRIGSQHQAGSDSLLTGRVFFKIVSNLPGAFIGSRFNGILYGFAV